MGYRLLLFLIQKLKKLRIKFLTSVKKTDFNAEISNIEEKYFRASDYNEFTNDILDAKMKQKNDQ